MARKKKQADEQTQDAAVAVAEPEEIEEADEASADPEPTGDDGCEQPTPCACDPIGEPTNITVTVGDAEGCSWPSLPRLEIVRRERLQTQIDIEGQEAWHNIVSLQLYHAENTVKQLRKDREAAIARLATLKLKLTHLDQDEQELLEAPAPLFEAEIAEEWRESSLEAAGIEGSVAEKLREAGIETLGQIAALADSGGSLTDIDGIGPETAGKIGDLFAEFFATNPRYCRCQDDDGPRRIPSRIRLRNTIEGDGYALAAGEEYDVTNYVGGVATVLDTDGCTVDVPFGDYAILAWKTVGRESDGEAAEE